MIVPSRRPGRGALGYLLAAVSGAGLAACSSYAGGTLGAQVKSWAASTSFWSQADTIGQDAQRVDVVERSGGGAAVRADCIVLSDDTRGAYQLLPSPDAGLTARLDTALSTEQDAAADCFRSAAGDSTLRDRSARERSAAADALAAARAQFDTLTAGLPRTSP